MIVFWVLAAAVSSLAVLLILVRAARAERRPPGGDPVMAVYRRQLEELDELAERGLLGADEHRSARAEAARRLIGEADRAPATADGPGRMRILVMAAAALAPLLALAGYLVVGSPGLPDEPYKDRLKGWLQTARTNPRGLRLPEMAAVLEDAIKAHPGDPQPMIYLAGAEAAEGDPASAARTLQKAVQFAPNDPRAWAAFGEVQVELAQGQITPDARQAFERARALDPAAPAPRYYLAQAKIAAGQVAAGLQGGAFGPASGQACK